ncbi:hypothetical protein A2U01_0020422 [Trifolium medium]|uniref:Thionin-like protein n=1 Tax=Trifolium medium TaxID=97028 RepID=A0A392NHV6_9FABA|nr:hypothetical protein [Trifolium medium]
MMASKKAIAALLICLVITMASFKKAETLSDCAKECMPVCLQENGATIDVCGPACEKYCDQMTSTMGAVV